MARLAHGKIFAVPLPDGTYVCGRVMLDIEGCLRRRLFRNDSPLLFYNDGHLVEMYSGVEPHAHVSPVARFDSRRVRGEERNRRRLAYRGRDAGGPAGMVEFPESLIGFSDRARRGGVSVR